ncbi:MAG: hypothetical protein ACP5US_12160 [Candidatus Kryptoniota bacterium]
MLQFARIPLSMKNVYSRYKQNNILIACADGLTGLPENDKPTFSLLLLGGKYYRTKYLK